MSSVQIKDYYQTLGVPRTASEKEIRSAYRKLARQHHPDLNPGDKGAEDRFKEVNEAHEVLTDPDKKKLFDRFGEDWQQYRDAGYTGDEQFTSPGGRSGRTSTFDPNDFNRWYSSQGGSSSGGAGGYTFYSPDDDDGSHSDFFETLFGGRGGSRFGGFGSGFSTPRARAPRQQRGEDAEVPVEISFDEAFRGAKRQIQLQVSETCPTCDGLGEVRGQICPTCDGTGVVRRTKTLEVTIPAGISSGKRVRMAGQGGPGLNGGPPGDVNMIVTVRPDPRFERDGDTLKTDVDIPVTTAVLGGEVEVATPTGRVALRVPAETQSGRSFRLKGQGMPKLKGPSGERGDLIARARIMTPTRLTDRERELYEELRSLRGGEFVIMNSNMNMNRQQGASTVHISLADWIVDDEDSEPRYAISVVASRSGVGRSMLLRYEEWGLIEPARTGRQRLYSEADIEQAMRVRRLMDELGINLAGAAAVLHLREQVIALQREMHQLRSQLEP